MNCTELFLVNARRRPDLPALWLPSGGAVSFGELRSLAARAQRLCVAEGLRPGDSVLLVDELGPRLYAIVTAVLSLGASVILVEPWMPVTRINHAVGLVKPRLFLTNWLGRAWGLRSSAIRAIPRWVSVSAVARASASADLRVEEADPAAPGIITFTSGTTGRPKGVVRSQGYLVKQHEVLARHLELDRHTGGDLTIFANFALANLASGRPSVIVPSAWKSAHLRMLDSLPPPLAPQSLTCGPAFLLRLFREARLPSLRSIHVGGALTDRWIFEEAFRRWPDARFTHVYGSSEAEPVAHCDAREAVRISQERGYFQTLYLGAPVPEIRADVREDGLWVAGAHVCPAYLGNEEETRLNKRTDADGTLWHFMGDRVRTLAGAPGWWYSGRSSQALSDFELEQRVYSYLNSSKSFVHVDREGVRWLIGEGVAPRAAGLAREFPEFAGAQPRILEGKIHRDRRHRARIDRALSLKKSGGNP
ncbi:MAG: AMP-binding protein [Oligoflexia bacterium]|nr:AMP-binding protein [Oligoflexia bacterium]